MGMSLQTAIHAFCFALTLSVHIVASQRKFCFIHAYILIACSFLEASKRNIYHFVSHLCLESICSISGCRREQLLAPIQYQPPWHMFIYLHLTSDSISNALTIPFRSPYMKNPTPNQLTNTWHFPLISTSVWAGFIHSSSTILSESCLTQTIVWAHLAPSWTWMKKSEATWAMSTHSCYPAPQITIRSLTGLLC